MRFILGIFLAFACSSLLATTTVQTQISGIDISSRPTEETLLFLSSGQVAKLSHAQHEMLKTVQEARVKGAWVAVTINKAREVLGVTQIPSPYERPAFEMGAKSFSTYAPSVIPSPEEAATIFKDARVKHKDSQCYNRAHIWSYEWRANHNLFTSKAWLFFTRKYIRKYNFEWWFHVAPSFHVLNGGSVYERVADAKYARMPLKLKQWTDIFLRNDADCPVVDRYSEWANYPETGWCYVMKSSMYYYQPIDLEMLDKVGTERLLWNPAEVRFAYKEAYDIDI